MYNKIVALILVMMAVNLYADDEDIFADNDLGGIEIDANFEDDFADIEKGNSAFAAAPGTLVSHPYDAYGDRSWVRHERSLGASLTQETINRVFLLNLFPQVRFKVWEVNSHLGLPLRFPVYDNVPSNSTQGSRRRGFMDVEDLITPRGPDFRNFSDAFRVLRQIDVGEPNQAYYVSLGRERAITLAQGELMKEMVTDYLYDQDYLFAQGHAAFDFIRVDAMAGPIPKINIVGLNAKVTPLSGLDSHAFVRDMSVDVSYVADYAAPGEVQKHEGALVLDADRRLIKRTPGTAQALSFGVASEYMPVSWLGSKPYLSFAQLWLTGLSKDDETLPMRYGAGLNFGHDASFYFSPNKQGSVLFFRSEGRLFSQHYVPNYFGGNYMLDRVSLFEDKDNLVSKSQWVGTKADDSWRFGHLFELGYAYDKVFNAKVAYENGRLINNNTPLQPLRKFRMSTSWLAFDMLRLQAGYEANSIMQLRDLFDLQKSRGLVSLRGQVKILSFLYFDSWMKHSFGIRDMYQAERGGEWLSNRAEARSLNYGLGLELAMAF